MELYGIEYLRKRLKLKKQRVRMRYDYYDMKQRVRDFGIAIPPQMRNLNAALGWGHIAVDNLANRLLFREFRNDFFGMNELYNANNPDILFDTAIKAALIGSCAFIYISQDGENVRLQVIDADRATGIIDPITGLLTEGYAVLTVDERDKPITEAYFTANETVVIDNENGISETFHNPTGYPLLIPVVYKPTADRRFGHSKISRSAMYLIDCAVRTLIRTEATAEFYSFPQKYVSGLSQDAEPMEKWRATMSSLLTFTKDDDGDRPVVGQFQSATMSPHTEMLRTIAGQFAAETGLSLDDLGFVSDNPASAEAIKSQHDNLRLDAVRSMRDFGTAFINAGFVAACLRDRTHYTRNEIASTRAVFEPAFTPDLSALSLIGDGAIKINQAVPNYFDKTSLFDLTGIEPANGGTGYVEGFEI